METAYYMWSDRQYKADINQSASGDTTVIEAVSGKRIAIDHINLLVGGATNIQFKQNATNYGGAYPFSSGGGTVLDNNTRHYEGLITTDTGEPFVISSSNAVQVSGFIKYRLID